MIGNKITDRDTIGSWITIGHPVIAEIMADAGFDWLAVDLEHSAITEREAEDLIRVIDLKGVSPIVRLTTNSSAQIKRILDMGAHGIIVPMVNSREDAVRAVEAAKYPPYGNRSFGLSRAQAFGDSFDKYVECEKENVTVIVQIEHKDSVQNIDEILSVAGVDAYFVGPYDLSGSLGIPGQFSDPAFIEKIKEIKEAAERQGLPGGVHIIKPDLENLIECKRQGQKFVAFSIDTQIIKEGCAQIGRIKEGFL